MLISHKKHKEENYDLKIGNEVIKEVKSHKHLGVIISNYLSWKEHIDLVCISAKKRLDIMRYMKYKLDRKILEFFLFWFY